MRIKKMMLLIISFLSLNMLYAENYMELIWEQEGEFIEAEYGYSIAAIDFNGDNIDDLVVGSPEWNISGLPGGTNQGKIYFYFGGTIFDTIPDLTIDGSQYNYWTLTGNNIINCGNINGDGYDDLGTYRYGDWQSDNYRYYEFYYGGPGYDTIPDFTNIIYRDDVYLSSVSPVYALGDINGDGYDDIGYYFQAPETEINQYYIIYGAEIPSVEYWNSLGIAGAAICGIGNINNDAFDDFLITFKDAETELKHNVIFYGNTIINTTIYDTLFSQITTTYISGGSYTGDFNCDGTDDFIGCWSGLGGAALWFGGEEHNPEPSVLFDAFGNGNKCFDWGDLNNDDISDIVLGSPLWSNDQGKAYFFIGDENANGSIDLDIPCPAVVGTKFGTSVAVGDFNNDGFDDAAIGAPEEGWPIHEGKVYVYAGNDSLEETTPTDIHEEEIPAIEGIEFNAYPNPFNPSTTIEFSINNDSRVKLSVYNIKGQKVKTLANNEFGRGNHSIIWDGYDESNKFVSSGVYYYKLTVNGKTRAVKKCMLLK